VMWGSDVGQSKPPYMEMVKMARDAVDDLPEDSRMQILWGTANRIYGGRFRG